MLWNKNDYNAIHKLISEDEKIDFTKEIFEGIWGKIKPKEEIKIEMDDDKVSNKNTPDVKCDYDEMGFENWFNFEENHIFNNRLTHLLNRNSNPKNNEMPNYTSKLYSEVYEKFLSAQNFSSVSYMSMFSALYKHLSIKIISSYLCEFSEDNYKVILKSMQIISVQAVSEKHTCGNTEDYDIFVKNIEEIISTSANLPHSKMNQIILK